MPHTHIYTYTFIYAPMKYNMNFNTKNELYRLWLV